MTSKSFKSQQIRRFKFWSEHALQDGMQYQYDLFQLVRTLEQQQRDEIYQQANALAKEGVDTLITNESNLWHLWLNLKHRAPKVQR